MPLGREVGLGPGNIVLAGDPAPPESPGFDLKNCDPGCKFPPKVQPRVVVVTQYHDIFSALVKLVFYLRIQPGHQKFQKLNPAGMLMCVLDITAG